MTLASTLDGNLAIVIPAYNEAATIHDVAERALAQCPRVIVVDDGSTDDTATALGNLPVTLIRHTTNQGKAASLWHGMQEALQHQAEAVITLDGDGQHSSGDIPRLVEKFHHHPGHIIIGARLANKADIPAKRYCANKIANFWISWAAGYYIADSQSGFRLYPTDLLRQWSPAIGRDKSFVFESEVLIKAAHRGFYSLPVPIAAIYADNARPSHFRGVRDITLITRMVAWDLILHGLNLPGLYRAWLRPRRRDDHTAQAGLGGYAMLLLSSLLIVLSGGISLLLTGRQVLRTARQADTRVDDVDLLLIPGMQLQANQPSTGYRARLERASILLQQTPRRRALILGGITGQATRSEAAAGKQYLKDKGIASERVQLEERSRNTLENLHHTKEMLTQQGSRIAIVSNRYHLARCHTLASGFGIQAVLCAAEDDWQPGTKILRHLLKEAFHLHWYYTGKIWATWTRNKHMLARIS